MRTLIGAAALLAVLAVAAPAPAQSYSGISPADLIFEPVTGTSNAPPIAAPMVLGSTRFSLTKFLPSLRPPLSNKQVIGLSSFPSADGLPGKNYLKAFGFHRAQPIR